MRFLTIAAALALALPAQADEVGDTIRSALEAWEAGDSQYAQDELVAAQQLIQAAKADSLAEFLPPAPAGWEREVSAESNNPALMMFGGGTGAEAAYKGPEGKFRISLMADNPLVAQMGAMLSNAQMMSRMGKVVRVGKIRFLQQDNDLSALVANRILVQAQGGNPELMLPVLEQIDFAALERWAG